MIKWNSPWPPPPLLAEVEAEVWDDDLMNAYTIRLYHHTTGAIHEFWSDQRDSIEIAYVCLRDAGYKAELWKGEELLRDKEGNDVEGVEVVPDEDTDNRG